MAFFCIHLSGAVWQKIKARCDHIHTIQSIQPVSIFTPAQSASYLGGDIATTLLKRQTELSSALYIGGAEPAERPY